VSTLILPTAVQTKVKPGHDLAIDPPSGMTAAERWTCKVCGDEVLRYGSNVYGSVTERTCGESLEFWRGQGYAR
jgi:hypothetical protein